MRVRTLTFTAALAGAAFAGDGLHGPAVAAPQAEAIPSLLLQISARKRERYISYTMRRFRKVAGRDRTLTEADITLQGQLAAAQVRVGHLSRYLRYDLDGDLAISRAEIDMLLEAAGSQ